MYLCLHIPLGHEIQVKEEVGRAMYSPKFISEFISEEIVSNVTETVVRCSFRGDAHDR